MCIKNNKLPLVALTIAMLTLPLQNARAVATVEASVDSTQILVGQQTAFHVSATVKPGQKVVFQPWKPQQQITPGIEVVDLPRIDTIEAEDGFIKVTQHLQLTSFQDTLYYIPAQKIKIDGRVQQTNTMALKVLTVDVDTLHPNQFCPPKDVQDNPFDWADWYAVIWTTLAAVACFLLTWFAYRRLKSRKPISLKVRIVKRVPPHRKALDAIEQIKNEGGLADEKAYYTQLTDTLRQYIQARFGFNAMEMTSTEIIERLQTEDDQEKLAELKMLFQTADLVKFAKHTVSMSENDRNLVHAVEFINTTKLDNQPTEERIVPTATEQERQTMRLRLSLKWAIALLVALATAAVVYLLYLLWDLLW